MTKMTKAELVKERLNLIGELEDLKAQLAQANKVNTRLHEELEERQGAPSEDSLKSLLHILGLRTDLRENPAREEHRPLWENLEVAEERACVVRFPRTFYTGEGVEEPARRRIECRKFLQWVVAAAKTAGLNGTWTSAGVRIVIK